MPYDTIVYEKKGKIAHIILNRPQILNAYNDTMGDELLQAHREFDQDDDLHVLILSGAGRAFCSGADVKQRQLRPLDEMKRLGGPAGGLKPAGGLLGLGQTVNWKPVIAAVHGYVLGAGFGLAMAADIIVHGKRASSAVKTKELR
jgi:enoyl-CoA hydratase/carnithine racemase